MCRENLLARAAALQRDVVEGCWRRQDRSACTICTAGRYSVGGSSMAAAATAQAAFAWASENPDASTSTAAHREATHCPRKVLRMALQCPSCPEGTGDRR
jgi:hypothetical protein